MFVTKPTLLKNYIITQVYRRLLLGRKAMTNPDSVLKSRAITLLTKVHIAKAMVFPVCVLAAQLCLTFAIPWTIACQAPLSMEFYCSG